MEIVWLIVATLHLPARIYRHVSIGVATCMLSIICVLSTTSSVNWYWYLMSEAHLSCPAHTSR